MCNLSMSPNPERETERETERQRETERDYVERNETNVHSYRPVKMVCFLLFILFLRSK